MVRLLFDLDVSGVENIPPGGPLVVYFNHVNLSDPVLVCAALPRALIPLSKEENMRIPILGAIARGYGSIPVRRGELDTRAFRQSLAVLQQGGVLLVAPEGTRSGDGRLQSAKDGFTIMALGGGGTPIPVAVIGQERFRSRLRRLRKTRITIRVGHPFRFIGTEGARNRRGDISAMTTDAMRELAVLLPAPNRGAYAEGADEPRRWITYENAG
jgi:1-acyl-sn-glycerol-3-phosphate acyltransferase